MEEIQKKVDENWKKNAEKEKVELKEKVQKSEDNTSLPAGKADQPERKDLPADKHPGNGGADKQSQHPEFVPPIADFKFFVTTLAWQVSIALGHMANPATEKVEEDLTQAKFLIDTLGMLQEKTKNNLTKEEAALLGNLLYELRVAYLAKNKGEAK